MVSVSKTSNGLSETIKRKELIEILEDELKIGYEIFMLPITKICRDSALIVVIRTTLKWAVLKLCQSVVDALDTKCVLTYGSAI